MRYVSHDDGKKVATALRPIYTAVNEAAAKDALEQLRGVVRQTSYPGLLAAWDRAWEQFIPFLEFDTAIRKVIYTTNAIESTDYQLRKIIRNRATSPTTTPRSNCSTSASATSPAGTSTATASPPRGERGTGTYGWKPALNALAVRFGDRLPI